MKFLREKHNRHSEIGLGFKAGLQIKEKRREEGE